MIARFAILLFAGILSAQPHRPTFEVASVKASPGCQRGGGGGPSAGRLSLPCTNLRSLVRMAYGGFTGEALNARFLEVVGGPGWLDSELYTLEAKAEGNPTTGTMIGPMLQALLEERFQLKAHVEGRESPVYALTVAKSGPKLTPAKEGNCVEIDFKNLPKPDPSKPMPRFCGGPSMTMKDGKMVADIPGTTLEELCGRMLMTYAGRPVVDKTGLKGRFDMRLEFSRDTSMGPKPLLNGVPTDLPSADGGPSIFTALQEQLGLKLVADKAPIDVIVVDSAQRPSEN
jgi:uncharacterized protein (TIGR03435 family)